jgi:hypothetical protein
MATFMLPMEQIGIWTLRTCEFESPVMKKSPEIAT